VDIGFRDAKLERTFVEGQDHARLGSNLFRSFLQKMQILASADSEADLHAIKSLHFEKLLGDRKDNGPSASKANTGSYSRFAGPMRAALRGSSK